MKLLILKLLLFLSPLILNVTFFMGAVYDRYSNLGMEDKFIEAVKKAAENGKRQPDKGETGFGVLKLLGLLLVGSAVILAICLG